MTTPTLLPDTALTAVASGATLVAQLSPKPYHRNVTRLAIVGPAGSNFDVYVGAITDACRKTTTPRGDRNSAGGTPIPIPAGQVTYFVWSGYAVASLATVTVGLSRE